MALSTYENLASIEENWTSHQQQLQTMIYVSKPLNPFLKLQLESNPHCLSLSQE